MIRQRQTAAVLPLVPSFVLLLVLASCAGSGGSPSREAQPTSLVIESFPTEQSELTPPPQGVTDAVIDATIRPAHLTLTAWGTPGCMPYPVSVLWRDAWTVQVSTATDANDACSTEYLAVSQVVVLPVEHSAQDVRAVEVDGRAVSFAFAGDA